MIGLYSLQKKIEERSRPIRAFYLKIPESERSSFPGPYRALKELEWFEQELRDFEKELMSRKKQLEGIAEKFSAEDKVELYNCTTQGLHELNRVLGEKE